MAVPHYEEEYGKSLATDLSEEFTDEIAIAVTTSDQFTSQLKVALRQQVTDSRQERMQLLQDLDDERTSLEQADQTMSQIDDKLQDLDKTHYLTNHFLLSKININGSTSTKSSASQPLSNANSTITKHPIAGQTATLAIYGTCMMTFQSTIRC